MELGIEPAPDDSAALVDEDSEEDLTYNSQGKPVPRAKPAASDKK